MFSNSNIRVPLKNMTINYSFIISYIYSFINSFIYSFIHIFIHSFIPIWCVGEGEERRGGAGQAQGEEQEDEPIVSLIILSYHINKEHIKKSFLADLSAKWVSTHLADKKLIFPNKKNALIVLKKKKSKNIFFNKNLQGYL